MIVIKSVKRFLRSAIHSILSDESANVDLHPHPSSYNSFNKEFDGWQFRIHRATNGGQILEVWNDTYPIYTNSPNSQPFASTKNKREHKLFIISANENFIEEFEQILTQLALEQA